MPDFTFRVRFTIQDQQNENAAREYVEDVLDPHFIKIMILDIEEEAR